LSAFFFLILGLNKLIQMQTLSIQELIAINETSKANALLVRYGYRPSKGINELVRNLFRFTKEYREDALEQLVKIHPHRDLIIHYNQLNEEHYPKSMKGSMGRYSNFEMEEQLDFLGSKSDNSNPQKPMQTINDYLPLIAVAGLFALTITAISK
jgi:hypothetical protein